MNWKTIVLAFVLLDFSVFSAWAVYEHGYLGIFEAVLANTATMQLFADLVIALVLVAAWLWEDARERGLNAVPYLLLTATLGSLGPLLYLIRRESAAGVRSGRVRAVAA